MKKYIILLSLALASWSVMAQELTKEEKKQIKSQLKEYEKEPEVFKRMIDRYKQTIDSDEVQLSNRRASINDLNNRLADAQNKVISLESEIKECQNKPVPTCPPCPVPGAPPASGTVYKIQLGVFKNTQLNESINNLKTFSIEKSDDKYRYTIGYFTDKDEAEKFVAELRKLGIKGAFAAKYENAERIIEHKKPATTKKSPAKK